MIFFKNNQTVAIIIAPSLSFTAQFGPSQTTQHRLFRCIERSILLKAPRAILQRALADAQEFGFGSPESRRPDLRAGHRVRGTSPIPATSTSKVDMPDRHVEPPARCSPTAGIPIADPKVDYGVEEHAGHLHLDEQRRDVAHWWVELDFKGARAPAAPKPSARNNGGGWGDRCATSRRHIDA